MTVATPPVAPALIRKGHRKPAVRMFTAPDFGVSERRLRERKPKPPKPVTVPRHIEVPRTLILKHRDLIERMRNDAMTWPEVAAAIGVPTSRHNSVRAQAHRANIGIWDKEAVRRFIRGHLPYIRKQRDIGATWATIGRDLGMHHQTVRLAATEFDPKLLTRPSKYIGVKRSHKRQNVAEQQQ